MTRRNIFVGLIIIIVLLGGWAFLTYAGARSDQPLSPSQKAILDVQDKRLSKGNDNAPVKIVEYADILCPYCSKANEEIIPQIESNYIDTNEAHYEVRLVGMIAPDSERAAEGAYCAAEQGKFWDYIDTAYRRTWNDYYSQNKSPQDVDLFSKMNIQAFAGGIGLTMWKWRECMDNGTYEGTVTKNQQKMSEMKAYGTPHFIINGQGYNGAPPFASFKAVIDAELNKQKASRS